MFNAWSKRGVAWLKALAPEVGMRGLIASAIKQRPALAANVRRKAFGA